VLYNFFFVDFSHGFCQLLSGMYGLMSGLIRVMLFCGLFIAPVMFGYAFGMYEGLYGCLL